MATEVAFLNYQLWTSNSRLISFAATFFYIQRSFPFFPPSFKAHHPQSGYIYCEELLLIQSFSPHGFVQLIMPTKVLYLAVLIIKLHGIFKVTSHICPHHLAIYSCPPMCLQPLPPHC